MENEVKFKVKEIKRLKDLLISGRTKEYAKEKEVDYSFDTQDRYLVRHGKLLRLRKKGKEALLTFKGPMLISRFKKREELNIGLKDFKTAWHLLDCVGFEGCFNKEKIRQRFKYRGVELFLDRLPFIGYYLEIEGKDKDILKIVKILKFDIKQAIKESYNQLFNLFCIVNQNKIKQFKKRLEFSFKCEREFRQIFRA